MLEGFVQWIHHGQLVREARANIRQEISYNARQADADLVELKQNEDRLLSNLAQLEEIRSTHQWHHRSLEYHFDWKNFGDSAWRSARDTGALGFMAFRQVQDLADVYGQQDVVNTAVLRLIDEQPKALAPLLIVKDVDQSSEANLERVQTRTADVLVSVRVLEQILAQLKQQYQDTLKKM